MGACQVRVPTECHPSATARERCSPLLTVLVARAAVRQGPPEVLRHARVVRQPGDGSCLFHSLSFGLQDGSTATSLRREIADFIEEHAELQIADSPLKDWVSWDSDLSVPQVIAPDCS